MNTPTYSAAILAGGKSTRFGSDKGLELFRGKPLVMRVLDVFKPLKIPIFIVSDNPDYQNFDAPIVKDEFKSIGPLGGLYSALQYSTTSHCFCVACDMPFLDVRLFQKMMDFAEFEAVIPVFKGRPQPLAGCYQKSALPAIEQQISQGEYKMTNAIEHLHHHWLDVDENCEFYDSQLFANINTREEWKRHQ